MVFRMLIVVAFHSKDKDLLCALLNGSGSSKFGFRKSRTHRMKNRISPSYISLMIVKNEKMIGLYRFLFYFLANN
ncbi:hypothetical protein HMPREF1015_00901 [Bacillus smithii 7_3_47FAA]|uniref:Uncharacterized protein n=1 Tax=Bacillus smithii 7_3_47FAA TaxID=665952 RepID=G9QMY4_9BACI|nr:hypothetical protein HMPREF1015_00901 [Bacillus smithii 7_3_47FAA]